MRGRSHRHRVPTARPPAQALGVVFLWGRGEIGSDLRGYLQDERAAVSEHDDVARQLAIDHGCPIDVVRNAWAWRVEGVSTRIIDLMTRDDPHVLGWTGFARELCEPSLALRNALNAMTPQEIDAAREVLTERFARPGHPLEKNRWIARDNRIVYFDPQTQTWSLGDYAGA